jgi:hypothetical protein
LAATQTRAQPRPKPTRASRPALRLVAAPRAAAARLPFALLVAAILGSGLVALLMLHTLAAQDGFTLHKLQKQSAGLADLEQQLTVANQQAQAPSSLAARARAIGMVPTGDLRIVRRHDGRVVGVATAMVIFRPAPQPTTTPSPAASVAPSGARSAAPVTKSSAAPKPHPASTPATKHAKARAPH